jgi:YidC/Oxa1 family membrane protein insertase
MYFINKIVNEYENRGREGYMFDVIIYPIGGLFYFIYGYVAVNIDVVSAYAVTIILTTILLKIMIYPLNRKQMKSAQQMERLQPKLMKLKEEYEDDKEMLNVKMMEFYKENNFNPLSGFLPIIIQMPLIIAFYNVIRDPLTYIFKDPEVYMNIDKSFFWIKDLGVKSNFIFQDGIINGLNLGISLPLIGNTIPVLALIAAITTYFSSQQVTKVNDGNSLQKNMMLMMPVMIFLFALNMPAGLTLYWIISNMMQIVQKYIDRIEIDGLFSGFKRIMKICFS